MNKIYKVLWNHSTQNWVVTSELSRGHVKSSSSNETNTQQKSKLQKRISLLAMAIMGIFSLLSTPVNASGETPVNASGETPVNASGETPVNASGETPVNASGETPRDGVLIQELL